ncbi:MAG: hypothetical protein IPO16_00815 [Saprospiraceae bacterium]|nr:hypothetical protein [Saprospiraceae bacterium]
MYSHDRFKTYAVDSNLIYIQHDHLYDDIKSAVLGNAGTVRSFRIGTEDTKYNRTFTPIG